MADVVGKRLGPVVAPPAAVLRWLGVSDVQDPHAVAVVAHVAAPEPLTPQA